MKKLKAGNKELSQELEEVRAKLRKREAQLFGKRSEKNKKKTELNPHKTVSAGPKRNRGQQPGSAGHGRRKHSDLPEVVETRTLPESQRSCTDCGLPYEELGPTEDSRVLEIINVKAYQRVIRRKRYQKTCQCCSDGPQLLTAENGTKLLAKSTIGVSIWAHVLWHKYALHLPLSRILEKLQSSGLYLAAGTVTDGFQKLLPLLSPVYDAIVTKSLSASHWHADETGWKVFEALEGKKIIVGICGSLKIPKRWCTKFARAVPLRC